MTSLYNLAKNFLVSSCEQEVRSLSWIPVHFAAHDMSTRRQPTRRPYWSTRGNLWSIRRKSTLINSLIYRSLHCADIHSQTYFFSFKLKDLNLRLISTQSEVNDFFEQSDNFTKCNDDNNISEKTPSERFLPAIFKKMLHAFYFTYQG